MPVRAGQRGNAVTRLLVGVALCVTLAACDWFGLSGPTPAEEDGRVLPVQLAPQQTQVWCWAAVSEMVFRYYNRGGPQCEVVSAWVGVNCCAYAGFPQCQQTAPLHVIQQTLYAFGNITSSLHPGPLPLQAVRAELDAGRPMIAAYQGSFIGHVVIIYGYDANNNILIHDPALGDFVVPYGASFFYNGQMTWVATITGIQPL
jgi:hypothetical protein